MTYCITRMPRGSCTHSGLPSASSFRKVTDFSSTPSVRLCAMVTTVRPTLSSSETAGVAACAAASRAARRSAATVDALIRANQAFPGSSTVSFES